MSTAEARTIRLVIPCPRCGFYLRAILPVTIEVDERDGKVYREWNYESYQVFVNEDLIFHVHCVSAVENDEDLQQFLDNSIEQAFLAWTRDVGKP